VVELGADVKSHDHRNAKVKCNKNGLDKKGVGAKESGGPMVVAGKEP
jgi:hypothetical protein